jgi:hypothetical protein
MNFYLDPELVAALERVRDRDGITVSEQVRRAVRLWLKSKGERIEAASGQRKGAG